MYRFIATAFVVVLNLVSGSCYAQGVSDFKDVVLLVEEDERAGAQISGSRIVGFARAGAVSMPPTLMAVIPSGWEDYCVRIVSADGRYVATGSPETADTGPVRFVLDLPKSDSLKDLPSEAIAAAVSEGACSRPAPALSVAYLNAPPDGAETPFILFVNSLRADRVLIEADGQVTECKTVEIETPSAFDMVCPMDRPPSVEGSEIGIYALRGTQSDPRISVTLYGTSE